MRPLRVLQQRMQVAVGAELDAAGPVAAARRAHRELDAVVLRELTLDPSACSAGCSHCCHVHVDATQAEVLAVAEHVRSSRSEAELAGLVEALTARVRVVSAMDHDERWSARIPCALLGDDGKCTIYEARPLRCRAFHSYSVETCREAFAGVTEPDPVTNRALDRACDAAESGFDAALEERGHSAAAVLLESALLAALT